MRRVQVPSITNVDFIRRETGSAERLYLLLHGYHQCGGDLYRAVEPLLPGGRDVIAPNGPFPLPRAFPLDAKRRHQELFRAYAWYFYDGKTRRYFIDYDVPATALANLLVHLNWNGPVTIIGYSQGGYLSLFAAEKIPACDHIIGVNCSWRGDKLRAPLSIRIDSINGACDEVVDPRLAHQRHLDLLNGGAGGEFHLVEQEGHALGEGLLRRLGDVIADRA